MKTAFIIYEGITALDLIGVYDPLTRLKTMGFMPEFEWDVCALAGEVRDTTGLYFRPTRVGGTLGGYDIVVVPGGLGSRALMSDENFIGWLRTIDARATKASVCTGALLLGAAGFLRGRRATTHPHAFQELEPFCSSVSHQRIVDEGDLITAGGVAASIDLGLHLCERLAGADVQEKIRNQMDYPYGQRKIFERWAEEVQHGTNHRSKRWPASAE